MDVGNYVKIATNHEVVQLMDDFGTCNYSEEDYDTCIYNTLKEIMLEEFGCTVPWLPDRSIFA